MERRTSIPLRELRIGKKCKIPTFLGEYRFVTKYNVPVFRIVDGKIQLQCARVLNGVCHWIDQNTIVSIRS